MERHFLSSLLDPDALLVLQAGDARADVVALLSRRVAEASPAPRWLDLDDPETAAPATPLSAPTGVVGKRLGGLALIAVPDARVDEALDRASVFGARAAIVFAEREGAGLRDGWARHAKRLGLHLLGPGALGIRRPHRKLDASLLPEPPVPLQAGSIAVVCQSGAIAASISDWAADVGVSFSAVVALGNEVDVTVSDVLDFLAGDGRTQSIVLYLEGIRDARHFLSALRAATSAKPVIVLRAGRGTSAAAGPALTHAGELFGSADAYDAALRRGGAVQIRFFLQLFATVQYLASRHRPVGRRLAVVSNGTGPALLAADLAGEFHVRLPSFTGPTAGTLNGLAGRTDPVPMPAGPDGAPQAQNPLIVPMPSPADVFCAALRAAAEDPGVDAVMAVYSPHPLVDAAAFTESVAQTARMMPKPLFACWLGDATTRPLRRRLAEVPVPTLRTPEAAMAAYAVVASHYQNQQLSMQSPRSVSTRRQPDIEGARMLVESVLAEGRTILTEAESKALLAAFQIPVTQTIVARTPTEAIVIAEQVGFPVVMKISSADIPHKHDVGGVALHVRNAAEVRQQYAVLLESVRRQVPKARIDGVGVEPMRTGRDTSEVYVGIWRDPAFGPVVACGSGGTQVALARDTTVEFPPMNPFLARRMLERTRLGETLSAEGGPGVDALEAIIVRVSEMVCELPWISEMDINPVMVDEHGAVAVDARVVLGAQPDVSGDPYAHLAIRPYPTELRRDWPLRDGTECTVRPIGPDDALALQAFMRGLSESTRYFRFISTVSELTPRQLARYTVIDYDREMALVAVVPAPPSDDPLAPAEEIIGVVRYMLNPDLETCEYAIVLADAWQGKGLGRRLMTAIVDAARRKGLRRVEGFVLANNGKMLGMMRSLGFQDRMDPDDPSMRIVTLDLR